MTAKDIYKKWEFLEEEDLLEETLEELKIGEIILRELNLENKTDYNHYREIYYYQKEKRKEIKMILEEYHINYSYDIWDGIRYQLRTLQDKIYNPCNSLSSFPGINTFYKKGKSYIFETELGEITVKKATETLKEKSLKKTLWCHCYARTYDLLKENPNYKAILTYLKFPFCRGFYHAYIESEDFILDPATNTFYIDKEDAKKILQGKTIADATLEELLENFEKMKQQYADFTKYFTPITAMIAKEDILKRKLQR